MHDPLLDALRSANAVHGLFACGHTIVVALSGGQDSCALVHALESLRTEFGLRLHAAHLNHMLRGEEADRDARFVSDLCECLSIPVTIRRADIGSAAKLTKRSTQEAARVERRQFLDRIAVEVGADAIALAHTADDRVETIMLNIIRGTGIRGLAAMPWRDGMIVRPLLGATRAMSGAYCRRAGLHPRLDASNRSVYYRRNLIRHELLPMIEARINPGVMRAILNLAETAAAEDAYLDEECSRALDHLGLPNKSGGLQASAADYACLHPAIRTRLVLRMVACVGGSDADITRRDVMRIDDALLRGRNASWMLAGRVVVTTGPKLAVEPIVRQSEPVPFEATVSCDGPTTLPGDGGSVTVAVETLDSIPPSVSPDVLHVPVEVVSPPLIVRSLKAGDRMRPLGMAGHKKLRDHLRDAGIPRAARARVVVVCDGQGILWVPGLAADERARIKSAPAVVYRIELLTPPRPIT